MSAMAAGAGGAAGLCWKTCCFPLLLWLVAVRAEDRTTMVEVGRAACTHLRAKTQCAWKLPTHLDVSHHLKCFLTEVCARELVRERVFFV